MLQKLLNLSIIYLFLSSSAVANPEDPTRGRRCPSVSPLDSGDITCSTPQQNLVCDYNFIETGCGPEKDCLPIHECTCDYEGDTPGWMWSCSSRAVESCDGEDTRQSCEPATKLQAPSQCPAENPGNKGDNTCNTENLKCNYNFIFDCDGNEFAVEECKCVMDTNGELTWWCKIHGFEECKRSNKALCGSLDQDSCKNTAGCTWKKRKEKCKTLPTDAQCGRLQKRCTRKDKTTAECEKKCRRSGCQLNNQSTCVSKA